MYKKGTFNRLSYG